MSYFGAPAAQPIFGAQTTSQLPQTDTLVQSPPSDTVTALRFSPETVPSTYLAATSWDNRVRVWEVQENGSTIPKAEQVHQGPAFSCCWSQDGTKLFSVGADKSAQMWDLASNQFVKVGAHDEAIKTVHYINAQNYNCLMTGGWDKKLKFWDMRTPNPVISFDLPDRVYCADVHYPLAVVGTAGRHIISYNLNNSPSEYARIESPLRFQSRCVSIFLDKQRISPAGFALGSIEGRVAVQHVQPISAKENFTFKCHRSPTAVNGYIEIYAVNDVAFHPVHGTLATVGSDGRYMYWDKDARTKLRGLENPDLPLTACAFNAKGQIFAWAAGYDWSKGHQFADPSKVPKISLHPVGEEMKPTKKL